MEEQIIRAIQLGYSVEFRKELSHIQIIVTDEKTKENFHQLLPFDHGHSLAGATEFCIDKLL